MYCFHLLSGLWQFDNDDEKKLVLRQTYHIPTQTLIVTLPGGHTPLLIVFASAFVTLANVCEHLHAIVLSNYVAACNCFSFITRESCIAEHACITNLQVWRTEASVYYLSFDVHEHTGYGIYRDMTIAKWPTSIASVKSEFALMIKNDDDYSNSRRAALPVACA